jgi:hypothetical protein
VIIPSECPPSIMGKKEMVPNFFLQKWIAFKSKTNFYFSKSPMGILHFARCTREIGGGRYVDSRGVRKKQKKPKLLGTIVGRV